jgi:hypothetical protein
MAVLALIFCCAWTATAEEAKKGSYQLKLTDRSPLSAIARQAERCGWQLAAINKSQHEKDYDIAGESFEVWVPDAYTDDGTWGLMVWISPGGNGAVIRQWQELLEEHKLVWIGPNKAGNPRAMWCRAGLALDAAHAMKQRYTLDPERCYVAGLSGGGRMSSMLGVAYPDVFTGGMYIIGCNYYRDIPHPDKPNTYWRRSFSAPPAKLLADARRKSRHVLLTGEKDENQLQTKINYEKGFRKDGFALVSYLEVPGMGHSMPPLEWVEKGLTFLDTIPDSARRVPPRPRPREASGSAPSSRKP